MRKHPLYSVRIMEGMAFLEQEIPAVRHHHERFDGDGYPDGLSGATIPLPARILAVADVFDALTSKRTFRQAMTRQDALDELRRSSGSQFDPAVVNAVLTVADRMGDELLAEPNLRESHAGVHSDAPIWRRHVAAILGQNNDK